MDERGVNQKTYKDLKADISQNTAINIGYYWEVLNEIPGEVLIDTIKEIAVNGWINNNTSEQELRNMLITESVKNMSYQEFKDIAHYFFGFVPDDEAMFQRVQPIEITRENYNYLVEQNKKAFGLERELNELKNKQNSLENKINNVETMIVPSENEVVGIDMKNEELLVLNSPLYSIIEEDLIIDDYLINDYRSRDNGDKQIIDYLRAKYKEIDLLGKEYILNNDTLYGEKLIFSYDIYEIDYDLIDEDQFKTLRDFYDFAKQFESFKEEYPMYPDYVESKYNDIYMYQDNPFNNYSSKILKNKIKDIQNVLSKYNKKLITKDVTGYSQGEEWKLGYLADESQDNKLVEAYLENFVGAWYKGTLARLETIPFESFDKGQLVGESTEINYINIDILPINNRGKLEKIKEIYPHLRQFKSKEEVLNKEKENNKKIAENRSKTIGGR